MTHKISDDRKTLTISVDETERQELRDIQQCGGDCQCDVSMYDFLEPIVCNSELEWINPADTGDLTDAPMLGIYGEEKPFEHEDATIPHRISGPNLIQPILERWAFMDYQVRSVLEDLRDKGEAVFIG